MNRRPGEHPGLAPHALPMMAPSAGDGGEDLREPRILMDDPGPERAPTDTTDLARVEDLLERCWRELDTTDLNVKLTDIVRLLEFKSRLRPVADAESVFWSLIDRLRKEELTPDA